MRWWTSWAQHECSGFFPGRNFHASAEALATECRKRLFPWRLRTGKMQDQLGWLGHGVRERLHLRKQRYVTLTCCEHKEPRRTEVVERGFLFTMMVE
jgi:hypothetical protein